HSSYVDARVDAVMNDQVDRLHAKAFQGSINGLADVVRGAVQSRFASSFEVEPEFCCNSDLVADRAERSTEEFFVHERSVDLCSVEECHAEVNGSSDDPDAICVIDAFAVTVAQTHAAEPDQ